MGKPQTHCRCDDCNVTFNNIKDYRVHLSNIHGEDHPCFKLTFQSQNDFEVWEREFEESNSVKFRIRNHEKRPHHKVTYKRCNRSPCFLKKSRSTGKRAAKKHLKEGPSQITNACTCCLKVVEKDGLFHVTLYPTHANHKLDNKHRKLLNIPKAHINEYIKKLKWGFISQSFYGKLIGKLKNNMLRAMGIYLFIK